MNIKDLVEKINNTPSILFLGQDYLKISEDSNLFLHYVNEYLLNGTIAEEELSFEEVIFKMLKLMNRGEAIRKLYEISEAIPVPQWLMAISKLRWSSIFTSSIDTISQKAFYSYGRQFKSVLNKSDSPRNYMSKSILHGTYPFGNLLEDGKYAPPLSNEELDQRIGDASVMLNRMADMIENYGILVIEGFNPDSDWIDIITMSNIISRLPDGRVFIFSASEALISNQRIARYIKNNKISVEKRSLFECLEAEGIIDNDKDDVRIFEDEDGIPITINKALCYLEYSVYNDVSQKYYILDDRLLYVQPIRKVEEAFLKFLRDSAIKPVWTAYHHGFYFKRVFDDRLLNLVDTELQKEVLLSKTIVLRGQNATGKTVSLCNLAMTLKLRKEYPVIFIPRETTPEPINLDRFISHLERKGASRTIIIWDVGAYRNEVYDIVDLQKTLNENGRKVLVIGSGYDTGSINTKNVIYIDAPAKIDETEELPALRAVLSKVNSAYVHKLDNALEEIKEQGNLFLAAMYGLFSDLHINLVRGVMKEVDKAENDLSNKVLLTKQISKKSNPFEMLRKAFGLDEEDDNLETTFQTNRIIQEVSDLVCVASQFGVDITLDLVLRVIDVEDKYEFVKDLSNNSMISVIIDGEYNHLVRFRSTLEAQLYIQDRFMSELEPEIECLKEIIANIKPGITQNDNVEVNQLLTLLKNFGPNGPKNHTYKSFYLDLSKALGDLREQKNIFMPGLILQEANFIRESYSRTEMNSEKIRDMKMAQKILREAVDLMRQSGDMGQSYASLLVELASNLSHFVFSDGQSYSESVEIYNEIKRNLDEAKVINSKAYHPIDVYLNSSMNVFNNTNAVDEKNEILADMLKSIDDARNANMEFEDRREFQSCVTRVNWLLDDAEIEESYYQELLKKGSATGVYLRAKKIIGDYNLMNSPDRFQADKIEMALDLLTNNKSVVLSDSRSILLMIQLYWICKTGVPIFSDERYCPALSNSQWSYIDNLCTHYINLKSVLPVALPIYLKAISSFRNMEDYKSIDLFEQAKFALGPSRVPVYLIHCDENGNPVVFTGKIDSFNNGKGKIKLLHRPVKAHFTARSFPNIITIEKDQELRNLVIGFNLMGPVAIPAESLGDHNA